MAPLTIRCTSWLIFDNPESLIHNSQEFVAKLTSRGFTDAKVEKNKDAVLIHLSNEESLIQVIKNFASPM